MDNEQNSFEIEFEDPYAHYIRVELNWTFAEADSYGTYWSMTDKEYERFKILEYRKKMVNEYGFQ